MSQEQFQELSDEQLASIDVICTKFEESWQNGRPTRLEKLLRSVDRSLQTSLLKELLSIELDWRVRSGERPDLNEYLSRFPEEQDLLAGAFANVQQTHPDEASPDEPDLEETRLFEADSSVTLSKSGQDSHSELKTKFIEEDSSWAEMPERFGRYQLRKRLGRGGMGSVYLAHDTQLDRQVAIKFPEFSNSGEREDTAIERFYREARSMATVQHGNLCPIYDVGQVDDRHFLTMAYVDGPTLAQAGPDLSADESVRILSQIARALEAVHRAGILHRDLKPSNVMINPDGEPVVMDFGLASRQSPMEAELTQSGTVIGSPAYMSPEQVDARAEIIGPATDVYALGVIFYQLLTGRRPFEGSGMSVLGQISSGKAPPAPSEIADVDQRLEAICLKAMAHDVAERYQSARELSEALQNWRSEPASSPSSSMRQVLAAVIALLAGLAALYVWQSDAVNQSLLTEGTDGAHIVATLTGDALDHPEVPANHGASGKIVASGADTTPATGWPVEELRDVWSVPQRVPGPVNSDNVDGSPAFSGDGLTIVFHRPDPDTKAYQLWMATRPAADGEFTEPQQLAESTGSPHTSTNPRISADGLTLLFDSNRPGGFGDFDLWMSHRDSVDAAWQPSVNLGPHVNSAEDESSGFISDDGLTLAFTSKRPGGHGRDDIWISTRGSVDEAFGEPVNAGLGVNSPVRDSHPWLSADGRLLLFSSQRQGGYGGYDLWFSTRNSLNEEFGEAFNAGRHVNSRHQEGHGALSPDGELLYFESTRPGGVGDYDIWISRRQSAPVPPQLANASPLIPGPWPPSSTGTGQLLDSGQELGHSSAYAVAAGDVDGDGDVDMLVANYPLDQPDVVWLNDGKGSFSQGQELKSSASTDVELGDLDADGDLDAIVVSLNHPSIIWKNDGSGRFKKFGEIEPMSTQSLALGDLDGDGDLDVMIGGRPDTPENRVLFNDGTGRFSDSGQRLGRSNTLGLALADFDGDGDLDACTANWSKDSRIWLNDGAGHFSDSGQIYSRGSGLDVALSDVDHDGDIDACITTRLVPTWLWLNDGHARFQPAELAVAGAPALGVAIADFKGDGQEEILIGHGDLSGGRANFPNQLLRAPEGGPWETDLWLGAEATADFAVADLDGDGDLDAFLANGFDMPNRVWINHRTDESVPSLPFRFNDSGQLLGAAHTNEVELADLDGDGDLDAVTANLKEDPSIVWINDGTGRFDAAAKLQEPQSAYDVSLGDLDGDGDLDIFLTNREGPNRVWLNQGNGSFVLSEQQLGDSPSNRVALADFDRDGDLDAWIGNFDPHPDRIWVNDGKGRFEASSQQLGTGRNYAVNPVDVDGDGDLDVFTGTGREHANSLWLNDGKGIFTRDDQQLSGTRASNGFTVGDINGDGALDCFETGWYEPDRVWLNDGNGTFKQLEQTSFGLKTRRSFLADFDSDGDLDVAVGNESNLPNMVLVNDGQGRFDRPAQWLGGSSTSSLAAGDLDGDGDIDLFIANSHMQPNRVWLNVADDGNRHRSGASAD